MKRIVWLTDIHLNLVTANQFLVILEQIHAKKPDAVFITGDIAESYDFSEYLTEMARVLSRPIYFVLGNHDFYRSSIIETRMKASRLAKGNPQLIWMTEAGVVQLTPKTALIGHESWADGRYGNYATSRIMLNDYVMINDLTGFTKEGRLKALNQMGDEAAKSISKVLNAALDQYPHVMLIMHVPPFREACVNRGKVADDDWLPHMGCQAVGDMLLKCMKIHPRRKLTVLCGHTHGKSDVQVAINIRIFTGGAAYRAPAIAQVLNVE